MSYFLSQQSISSLKNDHTEVVGAGEEDEDSEFDSWFRTHHFLFGIYESLDWEKFFYHTPLWWISNAIEHASRRIKHGFISNKELMMSKAALRAQGVTSFDKR